jgi:hypothetical protein
MYGCRCQSGSSSAARLQSGSSTIIAITRSVDWHTPRGTQERRGSFAVRLKLTGIWSATMQRVSDTSDLAAGRDMTGMAEPAQAAQAAQPPAPVNIRSRFSIRSMLSFGSISSIASFFSVASMFSSGSVLSIGSAGSILSIGSQGSLLSIGSAGSILSIGAAGGVLRMGGRRTPRGRRGNLRQFRRRRAQMALPFARRARRVSAHT